MVKYYTLKTFILSLWLQIINDIVIFIFYFNLTILSCASFTIIYCGIKYIKFINDHLNNIIHCQDNIFDRHLILRKGIQMFIVYHNNYCLVYDKVFKSISNLLLVFFATILPFNLILSHQFLFEDISLESRFIIIMIIVIILYVTTICMYILAHMSRLTHRTAVPLSRFQWRLKGLPFGLRHKIKVMSYFERLSSNRKFGITIGPTIAVTIPVFSQVRV